MLAHEKPNSPIRAAETIKGWIDQLGPCWPFINRKRTYERLARLAAEQAFDEIPSREAFTSRSRRAYDRWREIRQNVGEWPEALANQPSPPGVPEPADRYGVPVGMASAVNDRPNTNTARE